MRLHDGEMMTLTRIKQASDPALGEVWELYRSSFPREERRSWSRHQRAMEEPSFACLTLRDKEGLAGLLFVWEMEEFAFVEHLAIHPLRRGRGLGHVALNLLHQRVSPRPVILEIEPVTDAVTMRRCRFYESCGYVRLPYPHVQLPFHAGDAPLPMTLMSYPRTINDAEVAVFESCLKEQIMQYRDA